MPKGIYQRPINNGKILRIKDKPCSDCEKLIQRRSKRCVSCSARRNGKKHTHHTGDMSRFISYGFKGKKHTPEMRKYLKEIGSQNGWLGKNHTPETKLKLRNIAVKRLERQGCLPSYNESSISVIEDYGKKHEYNFHHAENGGEVKVLGYYLDGYDKEKNVVIEYMEKYHNKPSMRKKDKQRKSEIIGQLNCKWIEIWE